MVVAADAEAQAAFAKLDAQARGEYEIRSKRAEAIGRLGEAASGNGDARPAGETASGPGGA